jgi:hypothetical protein
MATAVPPLQPAQQLRLLAGKFLVAHNSFGTLSRARRPRLIIQDFAKLKESFDGTTILCLLRRHELHNDQTR